MSGLISGGTFGLVGQAISTPNVLQSLVSPTFVSSMLGRGLGALGIGDLPNLSLVLGGVPFFDLEIPEAIHGGGAQAMVVHKYPGGKRTIDTLGPDDNVLHWSGWFEAVLAESRARQLDTIRRQGKSVICSWSTYYYLVVIKSFTFTYNRFFHIGYDLTLEIVQDLVAARAPPAASVDSPIHSALTKINNAVSGVIGAVTGLPSAILDGGVGPALSGFAGTVQSGFSAVQDGVGSIGNTMLGSLSAAPMTIASDLPGISSSVEALPGLGANAIPVSTEALAPLGGQIIAPAGSPLAQQLDATPGSFSAGDHTFGPVLSSTPIMGTPAQSINPNAGSYAPRGSVSNSFPIPPIPPLIEAPPTGAPLANLNTLSSAVGVTVPTVNNAPLSYDAQHWLNPGGL